jgi:hypothetical protein
MKRTLLIALLAGSALFVGCGDEDETDTGSADSATTDTGTDTSIEDTARTEDVDSDAAAEAFGDTTFRLTDVTIVRPTGVGGILENLINIDIEAELLHVLIQMADFDGDWRDAESTSFQLTGNAGQSAEGGYSWYEGVVIDQAEATISSDGVFAGGPLSIIFPALEPGATEPLQIPVSELNLSGELFELEGDWWMEGQLSGAILAENIADLTVQLSEEADPQSLGELLGGEDGMDYPVGSDDPTGWRLEANINARAATFVE